MCAHSGTVCGHAVLERELAKKSPCRCACLHSQKCVLMGRLGCNQMLAEQVKGAQERKGAREALRKEGQALEKIPDFRGGTRWWCWRADGGEKVWRMSWFRQIKKSLHDGDFFMLVRLWCLWALSLPTQVPSIPGSQPLTSSIKLVLLSSDPGVTELWGQFVWEEVSPKSVGMCPEY